MEARVSPRVKKMMDSKVEAFVGFVVLVFAAGFLYWLFQANDVYVAGDSYEIVAEFRSAEGVGVGTEVRLAGIKVGSVYKMRLNPDNLKASVHMSVDSDIQLTTDTLFSVSTEGLLGGNYIDVSPGVEDAVIKPGEQVKFTQSHVDFLTLLAQFVGEES